jgi:hypothetical protein
VIGHEEDGPRFPQLIDAVHLEATPPPQWDPEDDERAEQPFACGPARA